MKSGSRLRPVIYTAIFGGYDDVSFVPTQKQMECYRFVLFSDELSHVNGWDVIKIPVKNPVMCNRKLKMFPWLYLEERHTFYIDGSVFLGENFSTLFTSLINEKYVFAVQKHRGGGNIGTELIRCIDNGKLETTHIQNFLDEQVDTTPLSVECGFIYRDADSKLVRVHAKSWWNFFKFKCPRDQLWVHQAAKETGLQIRILDSCFNDNNNYLKLRPHKYKKIKLVGERLKKIKKILINGRFL